MYCILKLGNLFHFFKSNTFSCFRVYPFICQALANIVKDRSDSNLDKEFFVSFIEVDVIEKLRDLKSTKVGWLTAITAQVVRTHPVHPELITGTFTCLDCRTVISNVEQQFKVSIYIYHFLKI